MLCLYSYRWTARGVWHLGVAVWVRECCAHLTAMFVPMCGQYLGGCVCHGAQPALLSAGVCHIICVVSGCGCGFQSLSGVVSHSV